MLNVLQWMMYLQMSYNNPNILILPISNSGNYGIILLLVVAEHDL